MLFISGTNCEKYDINMDWKSLKTLYNIILHNNIKYRHIYNKCAKIYNNVIYQW